MQSTPVPRHLTCSICSQLREEESAVEYILTPTDNTDFPEMIKKLKTIKDISNRLSLMQCPEYNTYYIYRVTYEFLIGYSGSYDEYTLIRIDDETGKDYLEGRKS